MSNSAPEKIYLQKYEENTLICLNKWNISEEWTNKPFNEKVATNIEYVRKDAFIEKACEWLSKHAKKYYFNKYGHYLGTDELVEDFEITMRL